MADIDLAQLTIMIVDDNHFMRRIIKTILMALRCHHMPEAGHGGEALDIMRSGVTPDIVITNWNMPEVNGIAFVHELRRGEASPNPFVPIIMVTAHSEKARVYEALNAGVSEFLVKPVSAKALYSRLVSVIERPRSFVRSGSYFGPCRRRRADPAFRGPERRREQALRGG